MFSAVISKIASKFNGVLSQANTLPRQQRVGCALSSSSQVLTPERIGIQMKVLRKVQSREFNRHVHRLDCMQYQSQFGPY